MATAAVAAVAATGKTTKAMEREQELPRITGEGMRAMVHRGPVRRCFFVASRSTPGLEHTVYVLDGGLSCDCISAHFRGTCAHKRVVADALAEEAQRIAQAQARVEEEAELGWRLTAKGRRALEAWRKEQAKEAERASAIALTSQTLPRRSWPASSRAAGYEPDKRDLAILRRSNQPFSLLK